MSVEYVLAEQDLDAPEMIAYLRGWSADLGAIRTFDLDAAMRFPTQKLALIHPAAASYDPCPVVGDYVGRPMEWLYTEMEVTKRELAQEDPSDGLQVFL